MKLFSPHAKILCFLYNSDNKNDFSISELSGVILCNYFMTDNVIRELNREKYITIVKKYSDKDDYSGSHNYKLFLTEKGKVIGENLCRIAKILQSFS